MAMALGKQRGVSLGTLATWMNASCPESARMVEIQALCTDSRDASDGSVFFAVPGHHANGATFAAQAVKAGAVAVVADRDASANLGGDCTVLRVDDVRLAKAIAAQRFHGNPSRQIPCIGVTGTNGKTTTCSMLHSILTVEGLRPTVVTTIEEKMSGGAARPTLNTTPDPLQLARCLAETIDGGGRAAVLEVSSHALKQHRTAGIRFEAAVFTQLSREHLDYHRDVEEYRRTKARLFQGLDRKAIAVLNAEDPCCVEYISETPARVLTYGMSPGADVTARVRRLDIDGMAFDLHQRIMTASRSTSLHV